MAPELAGQLAFELAGGGEVTEGDVARELCSLCGALPGEACTDPDGRTRTRAHRVRRRVAELKRA